MQGTLCGKISLNGDWTLSYRLERDPQAAWHSIPAVVPGNVELDLVRAGVEQDPFYDENLYDYRKYEFFEWKYEREFFVPAEYAGQRLVLTFAGVNTLARVFVGDKLVGECDNMMIEHAFDVTNAIVCGQRNAVTVAIRSAMNATREMDIPIMSRGNDGCVDFVGLRMPPHSFGWDIAPRLLSAGLWRGVSLAIVPRTRFTQLYCTTRTANERSATLLCRYRFETDAPMLAGFSVRASMGGVVVERPAFSVGGDCSLTIENPRLWWPRGYGEAHLYDLRVELLQDGQVVDVREERVGLRTIEIAHEMKAGDEGEFLIRVNGCPILAKGSNWVPLDAMHSRDAERYEQALQLFDEAQCNILRCWGGNVYEDHAFYDLCDRLGILVWQDFSMACALYPQDQGLAQAIEREAASVIRKLRNHPCILLWAGDNEVDEAYIGAGHEGASNRYNALTREVLPRAVRMHDPFRFYLPSSPFIPEDLRIARYLVPEQHNWGARAYFKDDFYKHTTAHFVSECGYHGCPSPQSLARFLPADKLWPYQNSAWDTHNTDYLPRGTRGYNRNQLMADQVHIFFGRVPTDLETFSRLSQVVQAEAKKFFIERTRIKKWRRTGIIWWNMIDGWPQISDAVVDYYFDKKRAFHYIKRVQQPICLMMDELVDWTHTVVLGNDSREARRVTYEVRDGESGEALLQGEALSPANENVVLGKLRVLAGQQRLFLLTWTVDGKRYGNHYISGYPHYDAAQMERWLTKIDRLPCGE